MMEFRRLAATWVRLKPDTSCARTTHVASAVRRTITGALVVALFVSGAAAQTAAKSFLWKVTSGPRVMYLAGSIHALSRDVYPLNPAYQRAFDASDALVEEINLAEADMLTAGPLLLSKGMFTDGRTFNSVVSKETAAQVASHLNSTPLAIDLIQGMKPWMVAMMLDAMELQKAGMDPNLGLDKFFFDKATTGGKTVIGLETAEYQIDRFDTMPMPMQEQMLRSTLADIDAEHRELTTLVSAWKRGDAAALEKTLLGSFKDSPGAYTTLVAERNRNWVPQMDRCMARTKPCFVIVGAAHLVGPDGLLSLLQRKGYSVEQQ